MGLVALRCALETPELLRSQTPQAHQTGDSVLAAHYALRLEFTVDARATIDTVVVIVYGLYLFAQFLISHLPRTGRPLAPGIIAAG